jgi:hypothetical protein
VGRFTCIEFHLPMLESNAWVGPDAAAIVLAQTEREWYLRRLGLDIARYDWVLAIRRRHELASRFAALLRANPAPPVSIRWWKIVPGVGPAQPDPADWPSPLPTGCVLPGESHRRRR